MRMITDFFSDPGQSALRNALEAASLILAILHSHPSRRRAKRRERKRRGAAEHGREPEQAAGEGRDAVTAASRVPRQGASAPGDTHAPLLSAVTRDPVPATHRGNDPATSHSDSANT